MGLLHDDANHLFFDDQLGDLDRVRRCALADLVAAAPEVQAILIRQIRADPADKNDILV